MKAKNADIDYAQIMEGLFKELRIPSATLARRLGLTPNTFYNIKRGENAISENLIDKIIKEYPKVHYWYLKNGKLPILLEDKNLIQSQANLYDSDPEKMDYSLESFLTLKSIDKTMKEILEVLKTQKKADQ